MKKIFLWEFESIVALDIKNLAQKANYALRIINKNDSPELLTILENPDMFIISLDTENKLLRRIKSVIYQYNIPTLFISSTSRQLFSRLYTAAEIDLFGLKYILKPFSDTELIANIHDLCGNKIKNQLMF